MNLDRKLGQCPTASCSLVHTWTRWSLWSLFKKQRTDFVSIRLKFISSARMRWHELYDSQTRLQTSWIIWLLSSSITSRTFAIICGVVHVDIRPEYFHFPHIAGRFWNVLTTQMLVLGLKLAHQKPPLAFGGSQMQVCWAWTKFKAISLLLISRHFDNCRPRENGVKETAKTRKHVHL